MNHPHQALFALPDRGAHLHLVGVCGAGMAPLALALRAAGYRVSGEDNTWPEEVANWLDRGGIARHATGELPAAAQLVIFSSAVGDTHPVLLAARTRGLECVRRGVALAALVRDRRLIAVVGSHGKTTTTAMLITALRAAGFPCDHLLGGLFGDGRTPPAAWTGAEWLVAEIDESDGTIANFTPEVTLCVNVDWDHCDLYRDPAAIEAAFSALAARTRRAVFCNATCAWSQRVFPAAGGLQVSPVGPDLGSGPPTSNAVARTQGPALQVNQRNDRAVTEIFSFGPGGDFALLGAHDAGALGQTLQIGGRFPPISARLAAMGAFNASNATGALAVASWLGAAPLSELLASYSGVRRRQASLPSRPGVTVLEDYAHHPAEIQALLTALRARASQRLVVIFQPHRYTRTAQFKREFARVLAPADQVFLLEVYPAGEAPVLGGTSADVLAEMHALERTPPVELLTDVARAPARIVAETRPGDFVLFVGAGDIDVVARQTSALLASGATPAVVARPTGIAGLRKMLEGALTPETILKFDEPLGPKTTIRVGGRAEIFAEPANTADLQMLLTTSRDAGVPVSLLGRGSNLIVPDEGVAGLVIRLQHPHWRRFLCLEAGRYWAGAGLRLKELCGTACRLGEGGFEFLEGIPGTVGGALRMNAGAMGGWMFEIVEQVHFIGIEGALHIRARDELQMDYRRCHDLEHAIALGAVLRTRGPEESESIRRRITENQTHRQASQPREPSAGCIFKNPPGTSAGRIIDELGLKGLRVGDAEVSPVHANFIINRGHATGSDVIALVRKVRDEVRARRQIELEPEVLLYGRTWQEVLG